MTRSLPDHVQRIADVVRATEAYLWSTSRIPAVTCDVCSTPTGGTRLCGPCAHHVASRFATADAVGTLIYAPYSTQAYHLVKNYKGDNPGPSLPSKMASLLAIGLQGHLECIQALSGSHDVWWAVVPSTRRPGPQQPLRQAVLTFARPSKEMRLSAVPGLAQPRAFDPSHFVVEPNQPIPDSVILVDDSWVGGGHAQSAACALKLAGVRHVAVFSVARVLDPSWDDTDAFIKSQRSTQAFEPTRCPWTADGVCP